jgi:hypothetical protein
MKTDVFTGTLCGSRCGLRLRLPPPFTAPVNFASETIPYPLLVFKIVLKDILDRDAPQ